MEPPIACTLSPAQYDQRLHELAGLAARALISRAPTADGERLVFVDDAETERELRAAIAAEADCCAFLRLDLQRTDVGLVLDVTGPSNGARLIAELFA